MPGAALLAVMMLLAGASIGYSHAFPGGDLPVQYAGQTPFPEQTIPHSGIIQIPESALYEGTHKRYLVFGGTADRAHFDAGLYKISTIPDEGIQALQARGLTILPDLKSDLHGTPASMPATASSGYTGELNYTGRGATVAVIDTGVDFSNPDMRHAIARDRNNIPIMLDADGQGLVITNATFIANINEHGIIQNNTKAKPENITSTVYKTKNGVFLDIEQGGKGTTVLVYNSFFPQTGISPTFNGTMDNDMKIGADGRDYIKSKSGIYRLGVIYQGALSGPFTGLQTIPVLLVDSATAGIYDTIIPDMSTGWKDHTKGDLPRGKKPIYDFDFTDEKPIILGSGKEFLVYDHDGDGRHDFSAGTAGAHIVDIYGVIYEKPDTHTIHTINGTLLPPIDPGGEFFGIMSDLAGHGTSSAATIASRGIQEYDIYNDTGSHKLRGVAPDARILPIRALWFGDTIYASLWAAGFEATNGTWSFSGTPRADIISNSWGISNFPTIRSAPGLDLLSLVQSTLATPRSLDRNYPGVTIVSSAGNSGHGYGTIGPPAAAPFVISVGATTSNVFVGYGQFEGQPRFGNTTTHANHIVDFSSRGPGIIGDPKPELVGIGAHGFVPSQVTGPPDENPPRFTLFGGTSMAAPVVSGAAAIAIQALEEGSHTYDPFRVRSILVSSADDIHNDPLTQGAGIVNADNIIRLVQGEPGHYTIHNDASYYNTKQILDVPLAAINLTSFGIDRLLLPAGDFGQPVWFGGHLTPGEKSTTTFTIENPSNEPLHLEVSPQRMHLIHATKHEGATIPYRQDPILNGTGIYAPNYIRLGDIKQFANLGSYFEEPDAIPPEASLLVLNLNFAFSEFMNGTDPLFANDIKISSLYLYDWDDENADGQVSSEELSMVSRAGSWGTVQEMRVSKPAAQFEGVPLVGIYPVPSRYSYWLGETIHNTTSINYTLSASYYTRDAWGDIWLDSRTIEVPPNDHSTIQATIAVPDDRQTGIYQGFMEFEGKTRTLAIPVSYAVKQPVYNDVPIHIAGEKGQTIFGNGYIRGAFDMANRYMAGDWRQFYFDIDDPDINTGLVEVSWEDPDTNLSIFAIDPQGRIIHTNVPPGALGHFMDWPTSDWLGVTPFSQGGGFFPVKNKDPTSSILYIPINQTGTYYMMAHSGLFGGNQTTEEVSIAAKFTNIPQGRPAIPPMIPLTP